MQMPSSESAMNLPSVDEFAESGAARDAAIERLSRSINRQMVELFKRERPSGSGHLAAVLVDWIEDTVEDLNQAGYRFGRVDYDGDIRFDHSGQTWSNGERMGTGIVLEFVGFACKVAWRDRPDDGD